jgi:hypothetical protein
MFTTKYFTNLSGPQVRILETAVFALEDKPFFMKDFTDHSLTSRSCKCKLNESVISEEASKSTRIADCPELQIRSLIIVYVECTKAASWT